MANIPLDVKTKTTLIIAHIDGGGRDAVFMLYATHKADVDPLDAIPLAFAEWAKTKGGREYIETNGVNWGDALFIPSEFLKEQGVFTYENAEKCEGDEKRSIRLTYDVQVEVDHDDGLIDN